MNRNQLTETGITVIILVLLYHLITSLIQVVFNLFLDSIGSIPGISPLILGMLLPIVLYLSMIYLLVIYKKQIASWINRKETSEVTQTISISGKSILHIVLILLCFITIINELPTVIYWIVRLVGGPKKYDESTEEYSFSGDVHIDPAIGLLFWQPIAKLAIAILLLIFSRRISGIWFKTESKE